MGEAYGWGIALSSMKKWASKIYQNLLCCVLFKTFCVFVKQIMYYTGLCIEIINLR